jgi:hypothetical protein
VTAEVEARLAARADREGLDFRVEHRPDGVWVAGLWTREPIPGIYPQGEMRVGTEATTREQAVSDLFGVVEGADDKGDQS